MVFEDPAVNWLLESDDPSIRYLTLTEILDRPSDSKEALAAKKQIPNGPIVKTLLSGQRADGGFGVHPYQKWTGAHWRLVSLVELGIPPRFRPAVKATDLVLKWLLGEAHLHNVPKINGRYRRCASQEGNALAVCSRLGLADDPRVVKLAESLGPCRIPKGDRRSRISEVDRESLGILSPTSSLSFGPYGRDHPPEHGGAPLSTVLALRHSTRTHDTLTSRKTG